MMTDSFTGPYCNNCNDCDCHNPPAVTTRKGKYRGDRGSDHIKRTVHSNSLQNLKQNHVKTTAESDISLDEDSKENCVQANEIISANSTIPNNTGKWIGIGFAIFVICVVLWMLWSNRKEKNKMTSMVRDNLNEMRY